MHLQLYAQTVETSNWLKDQLPLLPSFSIQLGTGWQTLLDAVNIIKEIPYKSIPNFPQSSVEGHQNTLILARWHSTYLFIWAGRLHYYEGHSMDTITFPVRVSAMCGVRKFIFTNASGGVNPDYAPGDIMVLKDHINFLPENPLRGPHDPRFGDRFVDFSDTYLEKWRQEWLITGTAIGLPIREGIYLGLQGPGMETPSEYQLFRQWGADAVGMSTVPEVMVARQMGGRIGAISLISNVFNAAKPEKAGVEDVIKVVNASTHKVSRLLDEWFSKQKNIT